IGGDRGEAADHRALADADELVNPGKPAEDGAVLDHDMAGKGGAVRHHDTVADRAVVADMGMGHEEVVVTDPGDTATARGAGAEGDILADPVAGANHEFGPFTPVFQILRRGAERGEGKHL